MAEKSSSWCREPRSNPMVVHAHALESRDAPLPTKIAGGEIGIEREPSLFRAVVGARRCSGGFREASHMSEGARERGASGDRMPPPLVSGGAGETTRVEVVGEGVKGIEGWKGVRGRNGMSACQTWVNVISSIIEDTGEPRAAAFTIASTCPRRSRNNTPARTVDCVRKIRIVDVVRLRQARALRAQLLTALCLARYRTARPAVRPVEHPQARSSSSQSIIGVRASFRAWSTKTVTTIHRERASFVPYPAPCPRRAAPRPPRAASEPRSRSRSRPLRVSLFRLDIISCMRRGRRKGFPSSWARVGPRRSRPGGPHARLPGESLRVVIELALEVAPVPLARPVHHKNPRFLVAVRGGNDDPPPCAPTSSDLRRPMGQPRCFLPWPRPWHP